jgi:anaerobic magnesium-protoporphyrin IX monomethyl ester cyclase
MKILLTHGYFLGEDAAEQKIMMPYPPQGLLHLDAYLALHRISSTIFDTTFSSFIHLTSFLKEHRPEIIGIYCNLVTRINIVKIIRFIRQEESLERSTIILGGPDVRHHHVSYLKAGADFCVIGEGEETMLELIVNMEARIKDLSGIKGITYKGAGIDSISTPERPFIKNMDDLPFPDFDTIHLTDYFKAWKDKHGYTSMTISTMRGCPYFCKWCSKAVFGNSYRRRSPEKVVLELSRLLEKYHPDQFWFVDDVFTMSKSWLEEFLHHCRNSKLEIRYECISRADKMDEEIVGLLKDSGCIKIWIGGESGSQKVLDRMDRRVTAQQVREMIMVCNKAGIETGTFLMLGYPGETLADIDETVKHLKTSNPDNYTLTLAYPIKGTAFYEEVRTSLRMPVFTNFGDYSDKELDFQRTYKPAFYKHAIRYVHHELEAFNQKPSLKRISPFFLKHKLIAFMSRTLMSFYKVNNTSS